MKDKDLKMCLELSYMERLSELQSQFDLGAERRPHSLSMRRREARCLADFYATSLPAVIVKYHDQYREAFMGPLSRV